MYCSLLLGDGTPEEWEQDMGSGGLLEEEEEEEKKESREPERKFSISSAVSPISLVRRAEYFYNRHLYEEAYRMARQVVPPTDSAHHTQFMM